MATTYEPMTGQEVTNGAAHVKLPQNVFGTVSVGEHEGTGSDEAIEYPFASGIIGATVSVHLDDAATAGLTLFYVGFNNTAFNNTQAVGNRFVIAAGESMNFNFESATTKPTVMTIRTTAAADVSAFYVVAEA